MATKVKDVSKIRETVKYMKKANVASVNKVILEHNEKVVQDGIKHTKTRKWLSRFSRSSILNSWRRISWFVED